MDNESNISHTTDRLKKSTSLGSGNTQTPVTGLSGTMGNRTSTSTDDSSISSGGAIGRQFNPEGSIGQMGEKIGGPLSKEGMIGSQFDASKGGIAGKVESMVGGPRKGGQSELGGTGYMDNLGTDTSGIPPGEDEAGGLSRTFKK